MEGPEVYLSTEEANSRIIPHIVETCQEEVKMFVVVPNDTSVVIYSLAYHQRFCELGIENLGVKSGIEDGRRNISIQKVRQQLGGKP